MTKAPCIHPPMGWNSFDCFLDFVDERTMIENIEAMDKYLKPFGWEYVVVDILWAAQGIRNPAYRDYELNTLLSMDAWGRVTPAIDRFPSANFGQGFKPLADIVHRRGMKFGIHIMRGVPRQAVYMKTPILGTEYTAADIANIEDVCAWEDHFYGIDMDKPGAQQYLDSLLALYAQWEIDFIKIDDLSAPGYHQAEVEGYAKAIAKCGREIVLSTSPGETPLDAGAHVSEHANMWRISNDFWDRWDHLYAQFKRLHDWEPYKKPGAWPDADMLPMGELQKVGPHARHRYSNFTYDEVQTMLSLWLIAQSPLMLGAHIPSLSPQMLALLTNPEAMAMNKQAVDGRQVERREDGYVAWVADVAGVAQARYVALFNISDQLMPLDVDVAALAGLPGKAVRDIWQGGHGCGHTLLRPHASKLYLVY